MNFEKLVNSIISENIGQSGMFAGDSGADAIRAHERGRAEDLADMHRRSGYGQGGGVRHRERDPALEREGAAENMFWNIYTVKRDENGKVIDRSSVRGKDGKQFGAYGLSKAEAVVRKLKEKPFNAGKEYQLMNNKGQTRGEMLGWRTD